MILVNVVLFEYFIFKLSRSRVLSLLSIVSLPLLFQFRNYHDPILSFVGMQQMILTTLLISLLFLLDYFETGNKSEFWLSVLFYIFCLQIYENTYSFFVFHLLIVYLKAERKTFYKRSLPFVVLPVFFTIIVVGLKHCYPSNYTGTVPSYDIIRIVQTFSKQVFAAFPFSYVLFFFNKTISYDRSSIYHHYVPHILLLASVTSVFVYYFCKAASKDDRRYSIKYLFIFGLLFLLVPGMLISLSQKYQEELAWGLGYIPVYMSYYGMSLLIALFLALVLKHVFGKAMLGYAAGLFLGVLFSSSIAINYVNNRIVVDNLNYTFLYPRDIIEEAAKKGLFKPVGEGSLLYINGDHQWDGFYFKAQRQFYELLAPRKFTDVVRMKDIDNYVYLKNYKSCYYLYYSSLSRDSGYAILGKLEARPGSFDMRSKDYFIYVRVPYYKPIIWDWNIFSPKISIFGKWSDLDNGSSNFVLYDFQPSIETVASGSEWRLYKVTAEKTTDLRTLIVLVERQYVDVTDKIEINKMIDFRADQYFQKGWSFPESTHRWSEGKEAVVAFRLKKGHSLAHKTYYLTLFGGSNGNQRVTVLINNREIGKLLFSGTFETKKLHFDSGILHEMRLNSIIMKIPDAHAPGNGDPRILGIFLSKLIITDHN
jgi:hypothetical protein